MHKIFGKRKPGAVYLDRKGAYLIPVNGNKLGVIKTKKGLFLPGGGIEGAESDEECIVRECLEETGYAVDPGPLIGSAEAYLDHPELGPFHPIQTYYMGQFKERQQAPTETGHTLCWLAYEEVQGRLFSQMQNWALEECWRSQTME